MLEDKHNSVIEQCTISFSKLKLLSLYDKRDIMGESG